jgi:MFS transporter, putative metabolite:H+ symporter
MQTPRSAYWLIIIAALGYFVDIYDLVLFNVVKKESLQYILPNADALTIKNTGIFLFNMQMLGMLIGGIFWGIWGDKRGRVSVLFGSILMYSLANVANAFVYDINLYAFIRIIAGIGLAGELGAGITLVSETMDKQTRGYGTMIIVTFGALGAVLASLVAGYGAYFVSFFQMVTGYTLMNWQVAYIVGGCLGLMLLLLRAGSLESQMFKTVQTSSHETLKRGDFTLLWKDKATLLKYVCCILVGLPIWFVIGILIALSEEGFAPEFGIQGVKNGTAVMYAYIGLSVGDLLSGLLSQWLKSRKKVVYLYLVFNLLLIAYYLVGLHGVSAQTYYWVCMLLGAGTGYWAIFVTIASEQFGTNIRSTVTNTVPNFVRGAVLPITSLFLIISSYINSYAGVLLVGGACLILAAWATSSLDESFGKDLDYHE